MGQAQFDYIRRLGKNINKEEDGGVIRAIGVLGSDIYDKLLILRALRGKFPNAIFFTNDLDARLFHETELPWTRNLIVASSYGLKLSPMFQKDIPPFRNVYQSSLFVATLQALGDIDDNNIDLNRVRPRIFEIGSRGPYDLTPTQGASSEFQIDEFMEKFSINGLCEEIIKKNNKIGNLFLDAPKNSTDWLNELLRVSDLYNMLKSDNQKRNSEISVLEKKTEGYRDKSFHALSLSEQKNIRRLNRLLLEEAYPQYTPKIARRIESIHPERDDLRVNFYKRKFWFYISIMIFIPLLLFGWLICYNLFRIGRDVQRAKDKILKLKYERQSGDNNLKEIDKKLKDTNVELGELQRMEKRWGGIWICHFGIPCILAFITLTCLAFASSCSGDGEPLSFFDGISIWPTEFIRLFCVFLAIYFILLSIQSINNNSKEIDQFIIMKRGNKGADITTNRSFEYISSAWCKYKSGEGNIMKCLGISAIFTACHLILGSGFLWIFGQPYTPFRGDISKHADTCIMIISLVSMLFLTWFVINRIYYCRKFLMKITDSENNNQPLANMIMIDCFIKKDVEQKCRDRSECHVKNQVCLDEYDKNLSGYILVKWLTLQMIAKRTVAIGKMVIYPFIIFALLLVARSSYFDHWGWTIPLIIVISGTIFITLYYAFVLFYDANTVRRFTIAALQDEQLKLLNIQIPSVLELNEYTIEHADAQRRFDEKRARFIEQKSNYIDHIISDLIDLKHGAFAPLGRNPIFFAILAPLGGLGTISILPHLLRLFDK